MNWSRMIVSISSLVFLGASPAADSAEANLAIRVLASQKGLSITEHLEVNASGYIEWPFPLLLPTGLASALLDLEVRTDANASIEVVDESVRVSGEGPFVARISYTLPISSSRQQFFIEPAMTIRNLSFVVRRSSINLRPMAPYVAHTESDWTTMTLLEPLAAKTSIRVYASHLPVGSACNITPLTIPFIALALMAGLRRCQ